MSVVTVTRIPQMIQAGAQGVVTLINEGPATVYLNSDSSAQSDNGFPLRPLATMTWQGGNQLWAVTRDGEARLNMNTAGDLSNPNRASSQKLLWNSAIMVDKTARIEVGSYETLLLRFLAVTTSLPEYALPTFTVIWYDDGGAALSEEKISAWGVGVTSVDIPIRGASCVIQIAMHYPHSRLDDIKVYGSTRALAQTSSSYIPIIANGLSRIYSRGVVSIADYVWDEVFLPSWGEEVTISGWLGGYNEPVEFVVRDVALDYLIYARIKLAPGTTTFSSRVTLPTSRPLKFGAVEVPPAILDFPLTFVWSQNV